MVRTVFIILVLISAFASDFAGAATPVGCTIAYEKLGTASVLDENMTKLMDGKLVITDVKTGEKFVASVSMKSSPSTNPNLFQPTTVSEIRLFAKPTRGKKYEMGIVKVTYGQQTKELFIDAMGVDPEFRQQGLSTLALSEIMKQFPDAKFVTGKLVSDNATQFMIGTRSPAANRQEALINGFKNTPFYKAVSLHGFTEIDSASAYDSFAPQTDQLYLKLRRPVNP